MLFWLHGKVQGVLWLLVLLIQLSSDCWALDRFLAACLCLTAEGALLLVVCMYVCMLRSSCAVGVLKGVHCN